MEILKITHKGRSLWKKLPLNAASELAPPWENSANTHTAIIFLELPSEQAEYDPGREALRLQYLDNVTSLLHKW